MKRREFLKYAGAFAGGGMAVLVVGNKIPWVMKGPGSASAAVVQSLNFHISDIMKEMGTHNAENDARCYFWTYRSVVPDYPPECPGPVIMVTKGDTVDISVTNDLDEPHAFYIPGMVDSGPILPTQTWTASFIANKSGAHLYYDNLNEPVNRMMGLHGALIVRPDAPALGHNFTPYDNPTAHVQDIFDSFGTEVYPGLKWEEGDPLTNCPPFRQNLWLLHQASPRLFAEVGSLPAGALYDPVEFMDKFLKGPFKVNNSSISNDPSYGPQYFTINGQSGFFSHFSPWVTPMSRVGEPVVVHILNAGLWTHSMHMHANHFYITSINGEPNPNPIWVDVYTVHAMDAIDYTVPFMRIPDVPNLRGIGRPDTPLLSEKGLPAYPCVEEFEVYLPGSGEEIAQDINGSSIDLKQRQSPLCYPVHDHSEPSQTSQGGNYNTGMIAGMYIVGDRNMPGSMDFPMDEDFALAFENIRGHQSTDQAAPPIGGQHAVP
ncbi:MAG: multicopper oxidase domain-containing protein [Chloroflexi bacterium]|nr:multicopper oxidase domain-containing protein [Chloroflexota bacterium]